MSDSEEEKIKRLLFTGEPFDDESLISFIMRLAEMNEITDIRWIYRTICCKKIYNYEYSTKFNEKIDPLKLSQLSGIPIEKIDDLFKIPDFNWNVPSVYEPGWEEQPRWHYFLRREHPKICPACLKDKNYCRKVWENLLVTACPIHNCLLLDFCRSCEKLVRWNRPDISHCICGFDFRKLEIIHLDDKELKLTKLVHKELGLFDSKEELFSEPINKLSLHDILRLLFFFGSHITKSADFSGNYEFQGSINTFIHKYICDALNVINNWAENYHKFIRNHIIKWSGKYFFTDRGIKWYKKRLPSKFSEYELFNQVQQTVLFEDRFSFIHEELVNYLENGLERIFICNKSDFIN